MKQDMIAAGQLRMRLEAIASVRVYLQAFRYDSVL